MTYRCALVIFALYLASYFSHLQEGEEDDENNRRHATEKPEDKFEPDDDMNGVSFGGVKREKMSSRSVKTKKADVSKHHRKRRMMGTGESNYPFTYKAKIK